MDYKDRLNEIKQRRLELKSKYNAVDKERKSLTKGVLDDDTLDKIMDLEDKLWGIHYEILATYDDEKQLQGEILDAMIKEVECVFKKLES